MSTETKPGDIDLITGPMFAGKSQEMLKRLSKFHLAKKECLLIRSKLDDRAADGKDLTACTHNKLSAGGIKVIVASTIKECLDRIDTKVQAIGIDEGQFFNDINEGCDIIAKMGIQVIVAALDSDMNRRVFPAMIELFGNCTSIKKLKGVCNKCHCMNAIFSSLRNAPLAGQGNILVGGADKYESLCRDCYDKTH